MRYRFVLVCVFAFLMIAPAPITGTGWLAQQAEAATVSRIVVEGNERVSPDTVEAYMQIGPGDQFDPVAIDQSIKALFQTGLFADVQITRRNNILVVRVEENPLINQISFEGNSEISNSNLQSEIELRPRMVFTRARVQSSVQRIVTLYRRSGLFQARVEPKIIRLPQNRVNLIFEIDEGPKTRIERISFIGNHRFSDRQLRNVITTEETRWWKFLTSADRYDPDRLQFDAELLRRHYMSQGYADFEVVSSTAELAPDGRSFFITFTVNEGEEYRFGEIDIDTGDTLLDAADLASALETHRNTRYDASKIDKSVENLTVLAGNRGFAFARARPSVERDPENRKINLTYRLQEGPRVFIERIMIVGNTRTEDDVIRRELRLVEGDAYNRVLIDRARRRITALDFFGEVNIREQEGSRPDTVVIIIEVTEKSTGTINFAVGYSTTEQAIGSISFTERNLLGRGQHINLNTSLSFRRQGIDFSFTEPYFMGRNLSAGIDAFATRVDQTRESSFNVQQMGGGFRFGFPLSEFSRLTTRYSFSRRDINVSQSRCAANLIAQAICDSDGISTLSMAGATYLYSDLDSHLDPTSGYRFTLSQDIAGLGGNAQWSRTQATAHYFYPLFEGFTVMAKAEAGHMESLGNRILPMDRFFKGGDSFRGFAPAGIGPRDMTSTNEDAIGGQTFAIGTLELSFPLGLPEEFGIRGAVFTEVGTLFNAPESGPDIRDDATPRASAGASLIWQSPFGPLRFDFAHAFLKQSYDKTEFFRFSVGARF